MAPHSRKPRPRAPGLALESKSSATRRTASQMRIGTYLTYPLQLNEPASSAF
jgi:hypothetical protein